MPDATTTEGLDRKQSVGGDYNDFLLDLLPFRVKVVSL